MTEDIILKNWHSRQALPQILNELQLLGTGVEVGVQRGVFGSHVRQHWNGDLYVGVDPWLPYYGVVDTAEQHERYMNDARQSLAATGKPYRLMRMTSAEAAPHFEPQSLDWAFLDGDHDYAPLMAEVQAYWPLVKSGGVLAGHDWILDGIHRNEEPFCAYDTYEAAGKFHCGPFWTRRVVSEMFGKRGLLGEQRVYVTSPSEDRGWQSFLIIKP